MKSLLYSSILFLLFSSPQFAYAQSATPVDRINVPEGFQVELLYSVPKKTQGSWVALTLDDKQRFIVSDQYGSLYRFPAPKDQQTIDPEQIEIIGVDIGAAQGLLYAFDSLYAVLNTKTHGGRGLYRMRDTNGDDQFDEKTLLRKFEEQGGEHGPHAVTLGPDGKSLYIAVGNQTPLTGVDTSRVPMVWDEDVLLERPIGRGFMKGVKAPGGWVAKTDPDGKNWELLAMGFRNQYDLAFDHNGELFTYDADMEWDINTPWYRPTRINHIVSGAEFGWRNGGGKWPDFYTDSVGSVIDIGPGSPTGITFGYGTHFPIKYQNALYICDWSYGKLYAVHLQPEGASFTATAEEFISAQPLPLTDLVVNPNDGALYFTVGGRRVQSGFYRVRYTGPAPADAATRQPIAELAILRHQLESYHQQRKGGSVIALDHLDHEDRSIRYAARVALEHQSLDTWKPQFDTDTDLNADQIIQTTIALARVDPDFDIAKITDKLNLANHDLSDRLKLDLMRTWTIILARHGKQLNYPLREEIIAAINHYFPASDPLLNAQVLELLVYLGDPQATPVGVQLLEDAPSQEEQLAYAKSLRHQTAGWTPELRTRFFEWFAKAASYKGGASFEKFIANMKATAIDNLPKDQLKALKQVINKQPVKTPLYTPEARTFVKNWSVADFDQVINVGLEGNRNFENGRKMFGQATCYVCHRFQQQGGALGPDLTSAAGKFSPRDLLEQIIEPSKEISDQYGQMIITQIDGSQTLGRITNLIGSKYTISLDMMNPNHLKKIDQSKVKSITSSPISIMPPGLINTLSEDDVLDLLAFMLSAGNANEPMFSSFGQ